MARIYIIMGVAGCGKSTVGKLLASRLGIPFHDGDDFHPSANVNKLRNGIPLTDEDRWPWYAKLRELIERTLVAGQSMVLACSALKEAYRQRLNSSPDGSVSFIWLAGTYELIEQRMVTREGHFMPPSLLRSQFETLEPPEYALKVEIGPSPEHIVDRIMRENSF